MDSGRSHRVTTGSVRQVARSCTRRALIAWRLGRALRRWPECGLSRPLGVSLSYELLLTRRALSLRSLLRWSPDPDRRVGNAVTFKSRYCTSCESKPLGNGDAVLLSRTPVRRARTHVSNRSRNSYGFTALHRDTRTYCFSLYILLSVVGPHAHSLLLGHRAALPALALCSPANALLCAHPHPHAHKCRRPQNSRQPRPPVHTVRSLSARTGKPRRSRPRSLRSVLTMCFSILRGPDSSTHCQARLEESAAVATSSGMKVGWCEGWSTEG